MVAQQSFPPGGDGNNGSGWAALKRKMSPLHEEDIGGEVFFNNGENQVT